MRLERWEEEIRELRARDAANEQASALLRNAQLHLLHTVVDLAPPRTCSLNERGSPASRTVAAEGRTTTAMARAISSTTSTHPRRCPPSTRTSKPHHWCAARRG